MLAVNPSSCSVQLLSQEGQKRETWETSRMQCLFGNRGTMVREVFLPFFSFLVIQAVEFRWLILSCTDWTYLFAALIPHKKRLL
jgi:hypothetical protein